MPRPEMGVLGGDFWLRLKPFLSLSRNLKSLSGFLGLMLSFGEKLVIQCFKGLSVSVLYHYGIDGLRIRDVLDPCRGI